MSQVLTVRPGRSYRNGLGTQMVAVARIQDRLSGLYLDNGLHLEVYGEIWLMRGADGTPMLWTTEHMVSSGYVQDQDNLPGFEEVAGLTHHLVPIYAGTFAAAYLECAYCGVRGGTGGVSSNQACPDAPQ